MHKYTNTHTYTHDFVTKKNCNQKIISTRNYQSITHFFIQTVSEEMILQQKFSTKNILLQNFPRFSNKIHFRTKYFSTKNCFQQTVSEEKILQQKTISTNKNYRPNNFFRPKSLRVNDCATKKN